MDLPPLVTEITQHLRSEVVTALGRPPSALYLYGSVALDDFRPGTSDIDFVTILDEAPSAAETEALASAHRRLAGRFPETHVDGIYSTAAELANGPYETGVHAHEGVVGVGTFERLWVTWHGLVQGGVTIAGPPLRSVTVGTNLAALSAWVRGNLDGYWREGCRAASVPGSPERDQALKPELTAWTVLGVTRLHYTLTTGHITSKTGAGQYALKVFDERWHPIVEEALAIRRGGDPPSRFAKAETRRDEMLGFCDMVIADAPRPPGETT
ncbi:aminoglycoside adenylyltransferase domain-containing protein [Stackebrandtia soli]|uniref:nucleotidyltransferase domain-containing protein n=1 Tax=Stackebrandtia soli TaxID=1892856 RepID=UPI0039ECE762